MKLASLCGSNRDLRDRRDFEEGMTGRVYRVCGACVKKENDYWGAESKAYDDDQYDDESDKEVDVHVHQDGRDCIRKRCGSPATQ